MAMRHPKSIVLSGALTALIIMTVSQLLFYYYFNLNNYILSPLFLLCGSDHVMQLAWCCNGMILATTKHF